MAADFSSSQIGFFGVSVSFRCVHPPDDLAADTNNRKPLFRLCVVRFWLWRVGLRRWVVHREIGNLFQGFVIGIQHHLWESWRTVGPFFAKSRGSVSTGCLIPVRRAVGLFSLLRVSTALPIALALLLPALLWRLRAASLWALPRKVFPKNLSFGEK